MELRSTEEEVENMVVEYKSLCHAESRLVALEDVEQQCCKDDEALLLLGQTTTSNDAQDVLSTLESLQEKLTNLQPKMDRFRKRLQEKDPITEKPRYGEKTATRVTALLTTHDALQAAIQLAFDDETTTTVVQDLRLVVAKQQAEREQFQKKQEEQEKRKEEQRLLEEKKRKEQQQLAQAQEEADLSRRAQEAREARKQAEQQSLQEEQRRRQEQERIDREWMDSIPKGPDGVRRQLQVLKESTAGDEAGAHATAINAFHTLFSQIVSHPEQVNFRRVRRDHVKFQQDIGRHDGGQELLIAAGFRLGAIDDVPCFISTEPDIETQMDEWSEWFDLLKATLEILEQELINS